VSTLDLCDDYVIETIPTPARREAAISGSPLLTGVDANTVCGPSAPAKTMSAAAGGRRWLAADCSLTDKSPDDSCPPGFKPSELSWDRSHQLYSWSSPPPTPALALNHPCVGDPLTMITNTATSTRVSVGSCRGFVRSPFLAVTGGRRTRDIVGLYDCDTLPGDCGSLVFSSDGVVGLHAGTLLVSGERLNAFYPFLLSGAEPPLSQVRTESEARQSSPPVRPSPGPHVQSRPVPRDRIARETGVHDRPVREAGIVGMSPAPSDLIATGGSYKGGGDIVHRYTDLLVNPWSTQPVRLPDQVVVPTAVGRFFANRTYTLTGCNTVGGNFLLALNSRLSVFSNAPVTEQTQIISSAGTSTPVPVYKYNPGGILHPMQWGLGAYTNPHAPGGLFDFTEQVASSPHSPWGDDFGASLSSTLPFVSAYRTLAMAIRLRIVGLPSGQFMTPGKIYFAQVRYDAADLPILEQDFVVLEQLGRASHVSADAVRAAGSKTVFAVPDGVNKLTMSSQFLLSPGIFPGNFTSGAAVPNSDVRSFPSLLSATPALPVFPGFDPTLTIVPYQSTGGPTASAGAFADGADTANADATTLLVIGYFGAQDGVVLEADYAQVVEYIPNKSTPGGVDSLVQLPNTPAMDSIFATAAVLTEARPAMIQRPGDVTISGPGASPQATQESSRVRGRLARMAANATGRAYREGFWDFDWLKQGSLGPVSWDFSDHASPAPDTQGSDPSTSLMRARSRPRSSSAAASRPRSALRPSSASRLRAVARPLSRRRR